MSARIRAASFVLVNCWLVALAGCAREGCGAAPAAIEPLASCAFRSREALCAAFRLTRRAEGEWVSDRCVYGPRQVSRGPIAEAMYVGIRSSGTSPDAASRFVEHRFLGGVVREPEGDTELRTSLVLVVRIGATWYPVENFPRRAAGGPDDGVGWELDRDGRLLRWTTEYGVPRRLRIEGGSAPVGATCAFTPVVLATTPRSLPSAPAEVAARRRATEILRHGRWRELPEARSAAFADASVSTLELYRLGQDCGGLSCYYFDHRAIRGSFPVAGLTFQYPWNRDFPPPGCDASFGHDGWRSQFVRVAPAPVGAVADLSCGFIGFDGHERRAWVVVAVFEPARAAPLPTNAAP